MSVCLGNITAGEYRYEFVKSLLASRNSSDGPAVIAETFLHMHGPYLDDGRNIVVEAFMEQSTCDVLLFVDSDIAWSPDDVRKVEAAINPVNPIVGGLYYSAEPIAYRWGTRDNRPAFVNLTDDQLKETNEDGLVKVDAIGTGFLGLHRSFLDAMRDTYGAPQPWFAEETFENTHHGEDFTFCYRAAQMGAPMYLLPEVRLAHYKVGRF